MMNQIQDDLDRALERLRATANRSLQNQADLDTLLVGIVALRTEVRRLEAELDEARRMAQPEAERNTGYAVEEVRIPIDPYAEIVPMADPGIEVGATTHPAESGVPYAGEGGEGRGGD